MGIPISMHTFIDDRRYKTASMNVANKQCNKDANELDVL